MWIQITRINYAAARAQTECALTSIGHSACVCTMSQTATSRAVIFATVGFSVGILYSVKTQRDAAKRRVLPNPPVSFLDHNRICGRWYQIATVDTSYFQRYSSDATLDISKQPLDAAPAAGDAGGVAGATLAQDAVTVPAVVDNGSEEDHFVPPSKEYLTLPPVLFSRRTEVLGGAIFGGKQLVTDAAIVCPDARHPGKLIFNAVSGMEREGVPLWVIAAGGRSTPATNDVSGSGEDDFQRRRLFGYMVTCDGPKRENARVYSRTPTMAPAVLDKLVGDLTSRGFRTQALVRTAHSGSAKEQAQQ